MDAKAFDALSRSDDDSSRQRAADLRRVLDCARRTAALGAFQSCDAQGEATVLRIDTNYPRRFTGGRKLDMSDLKLFLQMVSASGGPGTLTFDALRNAPPELILAVANAVRAQLMTGGEAPLAPKAKARYKTILTLAKKHIASDQPRHVNYICSFLG